MPTKIEWCDETWNPVTGCTKVSEGCRNCYAETIASRFWGDRKFTDVKCHPERLDLVSIWKRPRKVFVNSMSDLFHPDVPDGFIEWVWSTMEFSNQHTYLILTKRAERMKEFAQRFQFGYSRKFNEVNKGIWLGVSVENQKAAEERIPLLLSTPAAVRFVSIEPMLGLVDIEKYLVEDYDGALSRECEWEPPDRDDWRFHSLDWVICGGETGPHARPMHPDWVRSLRDQCQDAKIPFFFKSWGEWLPAEYIRVGDPRFKRIDKYEYHTFKKYEEYSTRVGKKNAGRLLDGREWNEYPKCQEIKRLQEKLNAR